MSKERLFELHEEAVAAWDTYLDMCEEQDVEPEKTFDEFVADYLLANGVIVPTSKVGEKIYIHQFDNKMKKVVVECEIIEHNEAEALFKVKLTDGRKLTLLWQFIGKTVFLTKEEAEAKLKEKEEYAPFIGSKEDREGH
jgi:hypothetical protein